MNFGAAATDGSAGGLRASWTGRWKGDSLGGVLVLISMSLEWNEPCRPCRGSKSSRVGPSSEGALDGLGRRRLFGNREASIEPELFPS
jgi:hypothetical protein